MNEMHVLWLTKWDQMHTWIRIYNKVTHFIVTNKKDYSKLNTQKKSSFKYVNNK